MLAALPLAADELAAWLRLAHARGLKPIALRALLGAFGLPQQVLAAPFDALAAVAGRNAAQAVLAPPDAGFAQQLVSVEAWRAQPGNALVTLADPAYPPRLLTMLDPPPLLYVKGRLDLLHARSVAVVGSRSATPRALEDARSFARTLAAAGLVVASELALGVDGAAAPSQSSAPAPIWSIRPRITRSRDRSPHRERSSPNGRSARLRDRRTFRSAIA